VIKILPALSSYYKKIGSAIQNIPIFTGSNYCMSAWGLSCTKCQKQRFPQIPSVSAKCCCANGATGLTSGITLEVATMKNEYVISTIAHQLLRARPRTTFVLQVRGSIHENWSMQGLVKIHVGRQGNKPVENLTTRVRKYSWK